MRGPCLQQRNSSLTMKHKPACSVCLRDVVTLYPLPRLDNCHECLYWETRSCLDKAHAGQPLCPELLADAMRFQVKRSLAHVLETAACRSKQQNDKHRGPWSNIHLRVFVWMLAAGGPVQSRSGRTGHMILHAALLETALAPAFASPILQPSTSVMRYSKIIVHMQVSFPKNLVVGMWVVGIC